MGSHPNEAWGNIHTLGAQMHLDTAESQPDNVYNLAASTGNANYPDFQGTLYVRQDITGALINTANTQYRDNDSHPRTSQLQSAINHFDTRFSPSSEFSGVPEDTVTSNHLGHTGIINESAHYNLRSNFNSHPYPPQHMFNPPPTPPVDIPFRNTVQSEIRTKRCFARTSKNGLGKKHNVHPFKEDGYICPWGENCDKTFGRAAKLKEHIFKDHCLFSLFPCLNLNCNKNFATKNTLDRHFPKSGCPQYDEEMFVTELRSDPSPLPPLTENALFRINVRELFQDMSNHESLQRGVELIKQFNDRPDFPSRVTRASCCPRRNGRATDHSEDFEMSDMEFVGDTQTESSSEGSSSTSGGPTRKPFTGYPAHQAFQPQPLAVPTSEAGLGPVQTANQNLLGGQDPWAFYWNHSVSGSDMSSDNFRNNSAPN